MGERTVDGVAGAPTGASVPSGVFSAGLTEGAERRRSAPAVWQPRQPLFWLVMALLLAFGAMTAIEIVLSGAEWGALAVALVLCAVQAVLLWLIVRAMPRFRRQPGSLRLVAILWGATVAPGVAGIVNTSSGESLWSFGLESLSASLSAPVNEDLLRLLGVFAVLSLASGLGHRLTVMDGAVYGFLVGAGFELFENLLYALRGDDLASTFSTGVTRLIVGFGLHALWTTASGAGLAYCLARRTRGRGGRWWVLVLMTLAPMLLHAGWDAPGISVFPFVKLLGLGGLYALTLLLFFAAVRWGRRDEFAWFAETWGGGPEYRFFAKLPRADRARIAAAAVAKEAGSAP